MWETLTAERLFKGDTEGETLAKILRDPVLPPSSIVPNLSRAFDAPLLRALNRDVTKRHATAKELALELERCCGLASPTEVGEWVEAVVGHVLSAREETIAQIESNSVGMTASQSARPHMPESPSDSDLSVPSSRAILAASSPTDTLPMGSGPQIAAPQSRRTAVQTPTVVMTPRTSPRRAPSFSSDEGTGSKSRTGLTGMFTGTMMSLPVDRKLPIIASIAGIIVLFVVVGVVVGGKFSREADAIASPSTSATSAPPAPPATASVEPASSTAPTSDHAITDPPPARDPGGAEATADPKSIAAAQHSGKAPAPVVAHATTKAALPATKPTTPPPPPPPTPARKNCDPPYTIDATGHRKYKLECM
jgi:serine/threonine-protein kinase